MQHVPLPRANKAAHKRRGIAELLLHRRLPEHRRGAGAGIWHDAVPPAYTAREIRAVCGRAGELRGKEAVMFYADCIAEMQRMDAGRREAYLRWLAESSRLTEEQYFKLVALHVMLTRKETMK